MRACTFCAAAIVTVSPLAIAAGQAPQGDDTVASRTFASGTAAVLVDVVVRDRRGQPVTGLTLDDFELYEDGVRQTIAALSAITPGQGVAAARGARTASGADAPSRELTTPDATPSVVALVFDRLSPQARALAHRGARAYLTASRPGELAGVFLIDRSIETIAPFTRERDALRAALDEVAARATSTYGSEGGRSKTTSEGDTDLGLPLTAGAEHHGPASRVTPTNPDPTMKAPGTDPDVPDTVENRMRYLQNRLATSAERFYRMMMHEQQGRATAAGLLALVEALGALEGRKTIVFFAESLLIPPAVEALFHAVVAAANRANVSIYAVDAAGLRVHSAAAQTANQLNALGAVGVGDIRGLNTRQDADGAPPGQQGERGDRSWVKDLELNEDILRQDPAAALGALATQTGGFLINNTNDLDRGFRQIEDDRRFHYLLAYSPANADFAGEYRRLEVRVRKRGVSVRSRNGYVASRAPGDLPTPEYERPALSALERNPLPRDVAIHGRAFSFPGAKGETQVALLVSAPSNGIAFELDDSTQMMRAEFTMVAQIRDAQGALVRKASRPYRVDVPVQQAAGTLQGELLFARRTPLPPGTYTLEYAVHDVRGRRIGAGRDAFTVFAAAPGGLELSSIVLIRQAERTTGGQVDPGDPLQHDGLTLHPSLGTPIRRGQNGTLPFSFVLRPDSKDGEPPMAFLELRQAAGAPVLRSPMQLPPADPTGLIRVMTALKLGDLPKGRYALRILVRQSTAEQSREVEFDLDE